MTASFQEEVLYNIKSDVRVAFNGLQDIVKHAQSQEAAYAKKAERALGNDNLGIYREQNLKMLEWRGMRMRCEKASAAAVAIQERLGSPRGLKYLTSELKELGSNLGNCLFGQDPTHVAKCLQEMLDNLAAQDKERQKKKKAKREQRTTVTTPSPYVPATKSATEFDIAAQTLAEQFARDTLTALKQIRHPETSVQ